MKKTGVILARFQPIHNGHLELIHKAIQENDQVLVIIGSVDKLNSRNPIPWNIRRKLVEEALAEYFSPVEQEKILLKELPDLSTEDDNSHDWGFYLYSNIVSWIDQANFTIYYSDGYEIITSWFPGFLLRNNVSLSLLARNTIEDGVSATKVRQLMLFSDGEFGPCNHREELQGLVPNCVYRKREQIKAFLEVFQK